MSTSRENALIAWGLLAVALVTSAIGSAFNLYDLFWWFDGALHAYAIFCYTLVLGLFAYGVVLTGASRHGLILILAIASIGVALGALWEVAEWAYDQIVRPNAILGKLDTILDLVLDTIGALAAGYVCLRMIDPRTDAR